MPRTHHLWNVSFNIHLRFPSTAVIFCHTSCGGFFRRLDGTAVQQLCGVHVPSGAPLGTVFQRICSLTMQLLHIHLVMLAAVPLTALFLCSAFVSKGLAAPRMSAATLIRVFAIGPFQLIGQNSSTLAATSNAEGLPKTSPRSAAVVLDEKPWPECCQDARAALCCAHSRVALFWVLLATGLNVTLDMAMSCSVVLAGET